MGVWQSKKWFSGPAAPRRTVEAGAGPAVLLAEDEQLLRTVIGDILTSHGYAVVAASDMFEALERLTGNRAITILLADVHLGLSQEGAELARRVHERRPDIGIALMSGIFLPGKVDGPPGALFLSKPFSPRRLLACVDRLTDERRATRAGVVP